jgi:hypothetical protein
MAFLAAPAAPHSSVFVFLVGSSLAPSFCVRVDDLGDGRRLRIDVEPDAPQGRWLAQALTLP